MAKAILIAGKICAGKTDYAQSMLETRRAVLLSCDEVTLTLFPEGLGEGHDAMMPKVKACLLSKATEILGTGADVILDWGFWKKSEREAMNRYFSGQNIAAEWHYVDVSDEQWQKNILERNRKVQAGEEKGYFADEGLIRKCAAAFEVPAKEETDVWVSTGRGISLRIRKYEDSFREEVWKLILDAKRALGRENPRLNEDLKDINANYAAKGDAFWIALDRDGNLLATLGYSSVSDTTEAVLHRFYVRCDLKRQGIGTQMLNYAEDFLRERNKTKIRVHLGADYTESHSFYPKHGYSITEPLAMEKALARN